MRDKEGRKETAEYERDASDRGMPAKLAEGAAMEGRVEEQDGARDPPRFSPLLGEITCFPVL